MENGRGGVVGDLEVLVILGQGGLLRLLDVLLDLLLPLGVHRHLEREKIDKKLTMSKCLITTSGGTRAGMATNSRLGSPISFLKEPML